MHCFVCFTHIFRVDLFILSSFNPDSILLGGSDSSPHLGSASDAFHRRRTVERDPAPLRQKRLWNRLQVLKGRKSADLDSIPR